MNYPMDSLTPFHDALLSNTLWLTSKKTGFPLPAGNHLPGVFGWSGYSCLVISKIIGNDSNLLIVFYVQIMPDDFVMQLHRF
ncbi:TPA: hypothetical protein ACWQJ9_004648 [Escherichia coli]